MKFKIHKYKTLDGNDLFKITRDFKLGEILERIFCGPLTYKLTWIDDKIDKGKWVFCRTPMFNKCDGELTRCMPNIKDLDTALEICSNEYKKLIAKMDIKQKTKEANKSIEVQIINGKDIISKVKNIDTINNKFF